MTSQIPNDGESVTVAIEKISEPQADSLLRKHKFVEASELKPIVEAMASSLLQTTPSAANAIAQNGRYLVEFSSLGTKGLKDGSLQILQRLDGNLQPTLIGAGRFRENAVIATGATNVAAVAAAAHMVFVLAVQAQLVSMERTLERIEAAVEEVKRTLEADKLATVRSNCKSLLLLRDEIATDKWTPDNISRWLRNIDAANVAFMQIEDFAHQNCQRAKQKLASTAARVSFLSKTGKTIARNQLDVVADHRFNEELLILALFGRLLSTQLRLGLGSGINGPRLRKDLEAAENTIEEFASLVDDRAISFSTFFQRSSFEKNTRASLRDSALGARSLVNETSSRIGAWLNALEHQGEAPVKALVSMRDGHVDQVTLVEAS